MQRVPLVVFGGSMFQRIIMWTPILRKKKYLLSDKQYSNIHHVNVLLSPTMKEKLEKCQLSLTMKEKPEKCQFRPFL